MSLEATSGDATLVDGRKEVTTAGTRVQLTTAVSAGLTTTAPDPAAAITQSAGAPFAYVS